jgi:hypothetical protein
MMQNIFNDSRNISKAIGSVLLKDVYIGVTLLAPSGSILDETLAEKILSSGGLIKNISIVTTDEELESMSYDDKFFAKLNKCQSIKENIIISILRKYDYSSLVFLANKKIITNTYNRNLCDVSLRTIERISTSNMNDKTLEYLFDITKNFKSKNMIVAILATMLAFRARSFTLEMIMEIAYGSLMIDIGMVTLTSSSDYERSNISDIFSVNDRNIDKLDNFSYNFYVKYPTVGFEILNSIQGIPTYVKKIVMFHRVWENVPDSYDTTKLRYNSFPLFYHGSKLLGTGKNLAISIVQVAFAFVSMIYEDKSVNSVNNALEFIIKNKNLIYGRAAELLYDMIGNKKDE